MTLDELLSRYDPKQEARLRNRGRGPNVSGSVGYLRQCSGWFNIGDRKVLEEQLLTGQLGTVLEVVI